ncbi:TadE/TadG family type IV pilus assembly protein [Micromonospora sp. NBC_01813]|uniref:TadE/TadG family type IV pilus assembly protein n=1 Tax=Micromonospora sp. NBC_01813 TaxID=2975988 RepID=UPI002DDB4113|nr:TadE/TadG family type IV pilus assembly protein [Micromonospora sp. NBC_01813]WSA07686.1 pilus assembly protein [Micromonospora sp. NBC_01813]
MRLHLTRWSGRAASTPAARPDQPCPRTVPPRGAAQDGAAQDGAGQDRGAAPVELAILLPGILLLLFASIQVASLFLARTVALSAAQQAVSAERGYDALGSGNADTGVGAQRAAEFIADAGDWLDPDPLPGPVVAPNGRYVSYTVSGTALSLVPGVTFTVSETANGEIERFEPAGG